MDEYGAVIFDENELISKRQIGGTVRWKTEDAKGSDPHVSYESIWGAPSIVIRHRGLPTYWQGAHKYPSPNTLAYGFETDPVQQCIHDEFPSDHFPDHQLHGNIPWRYVELRHPVQQTIFCLAVMLTLSFSRIPYRDLNPVEHSASTIRAIVLGLVVASVVPLVWFFILDVTEYSDYAKGLVFIAATPFTASVGPLLYILKGDFPHALRSTVIIYVLALLWVPFIVWVCLGESVDMMTVFFTVIEIIALPPVVSRLLTRIDIPKDVMSITLNCIITFLVWLSVSSADFQSA